MQRLLCLLALLGMVLSGCGGVEWFPDPVTVVSGFSFSPASVTGAAAGSTQTSSSVTLSITGTTTAPISVSGDPSSQYSVNGGTYTKAAGTVKNGDKVTVQHTASNTIGQTVTTTLTVGTQSATFSSTTGGTTAVTAFEFPAALNVLPFELVTSDPVTLSISGGSAPISISGDESSLYAINGGTPTSVAGIVDSGAQVVVMHIAADGTTGNTVTSTLTVGDRSANFVSSITNVAPVTASASGADDGTAQVKVAAADGSYNIAVSPFGGQFSKNGTDFTLLTGGETIDLVNGETLFVTGFAEGTVGSVTTYVFTLDGETAITLNVTKTQ